MQPRSRVGFSLLEVMIAITILGLLIAIGAPRIRETMIRVEVKGARAALANLYARARVTALQQRKAATLRFNGNHAFVTVPLGAGLDTLGAVTDLNAQYGVVLTAGGVVTVLPTGLVGAGLPVTLKVERAGYADSIVISGYGRMQ
jgi:prepilin-type N-terminal cleavage/methylation domain-containing protein